jgi:hypothetical protein
MLALTWVSVKPLDSTMLKSADENRERVVSNDYLPIILRKVGDPQLASVAVPVLYNTCCEYGKCRS